MNLFNRTLTTIIAAFYSMAVFAADPVIKEETTPPPQEGALTAQQIPPIMEIGKPMEQTPQNNEAHKN